MNFSAKSRFGSDTACSVHCIEANRFTFSTQTKLDKLFVQIDSVSGKMCDKEWRDSVGSQTCCRHEVLRVQQALTTHCRWLGSWDEPDLKRIAMVRWVTSPTLGGSDGLYIPRQHAKHDHSSHLTHRAVTSVGAPGMLLSNSIPLTV